MTMSKSKDNETEGRGNGEVQTVCTKVDTQIQDEWRNRISSVPPGNMGV